MTKTIREYLVEKLRADGYAGLYCPDEPCGCDLDDLAPCYGDPSDCIPGYKRVCIGQECERWHDCGQEGGTCYTGTPEAAP